MYHHHRHRHDYKSKSSLPARARAHTDTHKTKVKNLENQVNVGLGSFIAIMQRIWQRSGTLFKRQVHKKIIFLPRESLQAQCLRRRDLLLNLEQRESGERLTCRQVLKVRVGRLPVNHKELGRPKDG
jgi:hypothetical protein